MDALRHDPVARLEPRVHPSPEPGTALDMAMADKANAQKATAHEEMNAFLGRTLSHVRWFTIAALLVVSFVQPLIGRIGLPTWMLLLAFAGYNWSVGILMQRGSGWLADPTHAAVLDLVVVSALYAVGASPNGTLSVLFLLVTVCAAATNPYPHGLLVTGAALVVLAAVSPTLPLWSPSEGGVRDLIARLIVVALAGAMTGLLVRELQREQGLARTNAAHAERQAELNRLRSAFVSGVSHDLRTPLTAMTAGLGLLELSLRERLRSDEAELLAAIRRNGERLGLLIDDLLTHHQLEAGVLRLAPVALDLRALLEGAVAALRPLLDEKGQRVTLDISDPETAPEREQTPLQAFGDPRRLEQALVNVLANAHRHTPAGARIQVTCRLTSTEVRMTVSDDGPGIPEADLERIFERFHRLGTASDGSGLGLAIARSIIELHGGRIWAESASGVAEGKGDAGGGGGGGETWTGVRICLTLPTAGPPTERDGNTAREDADRTNDWAQIPETEEQHAAESAHRRRRA